MYMRVEVFSFLQGVMLRDARVDMILAFFDFDKNRKCQTYHVLLKVYAVKEMHFYHFTIHV